MSFSERRAIKHLKTPVSGIFRVTGFHDAKSGLHFTGVITAPGIPDTPVEHKTDREGRWAESTELPVVVDQADPSRFVILWDQVDSDSWGSQGTGAGGGARFVTTVTIGRDGQPAQLSAQDAARVAEALQATLGGLSAAFGASGGGFPAADGGFPAPGSGFPAPAGGFPAPAGVWPVAPGAQPAGLLPGEHGTAVVLDAREIPVQPGFPVPPGGQYELLLEVTRWQGGPYQTRTVIGFSSPEQRAAVAVPGRRLRVGIDPAAPDRVTIDTTRIS
jgi:hypothetical protein